MTPGSYILHALTLPASGPVDCPHSPDADAWGLCSTAPTLRLTLFGTIVSGLAPGQAVTVESPCYFYHLAAWGVHPVLDLPPSPPPSVYRCASWSWVIVHDDPPTIEDHGGGITAEVCRAVITLVPDDLGAVAFSKLRDGSTIYVTSTMLGTGYYTNVRDFDLNLFVNGDDDDSFELAFVLGDQAADFDCNGYVNGDDIDLWRAYFADPGLEPPRQEPTSIDPHEEPTSISGVTP